MHFASARLKKKAAAWVGSLNNLSTRCRCIVPTDGSIPPASWICVVFQLNKPRSKLLPGLLLGLAAWVSLDAGVAHAASGVLNVRLGGDRSETRIVMDLGRAVSGKVADDAQGDRTLSIQLAGLRIDEDMGGVGLGLVKSWSVSPTATGSRLNIETTTGATIKRRFLLPPADGVGNYRYVIDIIKNSPSLTSAESTVKPASAILTSMPQPGLKPLSFRKIIVIDAGHGGRDPGAKGDRRVEKDITLASALALKARLERSGRYQVVLTRSSDVYVPLDSRVQIARRADADLFISLHADSGPDSGTRGASVYTLADHASARSAKLITKDDWFMKANFQGDRGVSGILYDLTQRATKNRSASFAEMLLDRVSTQQVLVRRSHREAGLAVLLAPDVPAVLLEMGFITNRQDEATLGESSGRVRLMGAVADTIDAYFARELRFASR